MIATFDIEAVARKASEEYRAARRALLGTRLCQASEQTDAIARQLEEELTRFAYDVTVAMLR